MTCKHLNNVASIVERIDTLEALCAEQQKLIVELTKSLAKLGITVSHNEKDIRRALCMAGKAQNPPRFKR